jgi:hypothetical protein
MYKDTRNSPKKLALESIGCEEQILYSFAEKLKTLIDDIGGSQYAPSLLPPLESMVSSYVPLKTREKVNMFLYVYHEHIFHYYIVFDRQFHRCALCFRCLIAVKFLGKLFPF